LAWSPPVLRRFRLRDPLRGPAKFESPAAATLEVPDREQRTPEYLAKFLESEIGKWAAPIKASGVSVE